jgi:hypothetical protein
MGIPMIGAHLSAWCRVILTCLFSSIATLLLGFTDPSGFLFRFLIFSTLSAMFLKIEKLGRLVQCRDVEKFTCCVQLFFCRSSSHRQILAGLVLPQL